MDTINQRFDAVVKTLKTEKITMTEIAKKLNLSQSFLSTVCSGKSGISDRTISDFCAAYNVSETWLRTGDGEMFKQRSNKEEIAAYMAEVLSGQRTDVEETLIRFMAHTTDEKWELLNNLLDRLLDEKKMADTE